MDKEKKLVKLNKSKGSEFLSINDATFKFGGGIAGTITARYYKGICADNDNMILERYEKREK